MALCKEMWRNIHPEKESLFESSIQSQNEEYEVLETKGTVWQSGIECEKMIEVEKCTTCLNCMVHCRWTQRYMKSMLNNDRTMYEIRKLLTDNCGNQIVNLIMNVFLEFEAPDYSQEGIDTFTAYVNDENTMRNLDIYGAFVNNNIVGVIAARNEKQHISLFFVDGKYHRKGIGKLLFSTFIDNTHAKVITVNSSPYAVEFYRKLGFVDTDAEQTQDGMRYTPMRYENPRFYDNKSVLGNEIRWHMNK